MTTYKLFYSMDKHIAKVVTNIRKYQNETCISTTPNPINSLMKQTFQL